MSGFVSVDRINALKSGIESKTGETYTDLTAGVQALVDGFGQGGGGSSYKTASGTITLDADAQYVMVTGLAFTPIVFVVAPTTIIATSTVGAVFVRGAGALWRTGTGNTNLSPMAHKLELDGYTVHPDDSGFNTTINPFYDNLVRVFDSGFGFRQYNGTFPIRAGAEFEWWAIGE